MNASDPRRLDRIRWRARRGLLENDILLGRFLDAELEQLQGEELKNLETLLTWEDNDLLDVLMGRTDCPDANLTALVERIRAL